MGYESGCCVFRVVIQHNSGVRLVLFCLCCLAYLGSLIVILATMSRELRFSIGKMRGSSGVVYYRIQVPARFSASGKSRSMYFRTLKEAQREQSALRERLREGELASGGVLTPREALDVRVALDELKQSGLDLSLVDVVRLGIEREKARCSGGKVAELCRQYEEGVAVARAWSKAHERNWRYYCRAFVAEFGDQFASELERNVLRRWLSNRFPGDSYFNSAISVLSPCFTWAVKHELLAKNPFDGVERRRIVRESAVDVLSLEEVRRVFACCVGELADCGLAFAVLLFGGVRPDEFNKLTWDLVHLDDGFLVIPPSIAKTRSVRHVEITDALASWLGAVPVNERVGLLRPVDWLRKVRAVRKASGLVGRHDVAVEFWGIRKSLPCGGHDSDLPTDDV